MTTIDATPHEPAAGTHHHDLPVGEPMHKHHVCSVRTFGGIIVALLILTWFTVWVSFHDFGSANMLIAMAVATVKASLVMAVFMHLMWDTPINRLFFLSSFLFLGLLFLFTFADYLGRGDLERKHLRSAPLNSIEKTDMFPPGSAARRLLERLKEHAEKTENQ